MRPDHGPPFATPAVCGLSTLSGWWITRGSRQQRMEPGRPEPNGAHERRPRPRTADATRPPEPHQVAPPARVARCGREDHAARPHAARHSSTQAARSRPSPRALPAQLPAPTEPGHSLVRRVSTAGTVRVQTHQLFLRETRRQEDIAVEETGDGIWSISCDAVLLARLDARDFKRSV
jgi:putative transposase